MPAAAYVWAPVAVPDPTDSEIAPALIDPSPQFQLAVWESRVPGSAKVAEAWTEVPIAIGAAGSPVMAPTDGGALETVKVVVAVVVRPPLSVADSVRVYPPSSLHDTEVLGAAGLAITQ